MTVVFGLLAVALWEGIGVGTRSWSQVEQGYRRAVMFQGTEDALRRLIERIDLSDPDSEPALTGDANRLMILSWLPEKKGYARTVEAAFGLNNREQFILRWRRYRRADCTEEDNPFQEEVLATNIARVDFSYYGQRSGQWLWLDDWHDETLPALVKVRFTTIKGAKAWPAILIRPLLGVTDTQ